MAGGFIGRVISYVANELIVNGLANSKAFQRFAVRTSKGLEDISSKVAQKKQQATDRLKDFPKTFEDK